MKKLSPLTAVLFILSNIFSANAETLIPEQCSVGNKPIYAPIEEIYFTFNRAIVSQENVTASILLDDEITATGNLSVTNYSENNYTQGVASFKFDPPVSLPKGKVYQFRVPEGVICLESDTESKNEQINVDITIPEHLEAMPVSIEPDLENYSLDIYYSTGIKSIVKPTIQLYRKNVLVRSFPAFVSSDLNLGTVTTGFLDYELCFENGIDYTIILEANSVSALKRDDIVNKEERVDFIGGYEGLPALTYSFYGFGDAAVEGLGRITFTYDRPIMIDPEAKIQLFQDGDNPVMEVTPTIQELNGKWRLTADFTQAMIDKDRGYSVVIPAETVISADGDIIVNDRNELAINGGSGVEGIDSDNIKVSAADGTVRIEGAPTGTPIEIYSPSGRLVTKTTDTSVNLPAPGIYILKIANSATKIILP